MHWHEVAPLLEAKGMRATFYTPISPGFRTDLESWRSLAAAGHELGNHTVFHPAHATLVDWLEGHRNEVWSGPVLGLVRHLQRRRSAAPSPGEVSGGQAVHGDR